MKKGKDTDTKVLMGVYIAILAYSIYLDLKDLKRWYRGRKKAKAKKQS